MQATSNLVSTTTPRHYGGAFHVAAKRGQLPLVQWLAPHVPRRFLKEAMKKAARGGHLHVILWLMSAYKLEWTWRITRAAAVNQQGVLLHWAMGNGGTYHDSIIPYAVERTDWPLLHWCKRMEPEMIEICCEASKRGNLAIVQWSYDDHEQAYYYPRVMYYAIRGGHLPVVQWLYSRTCRKQMFYLHDALFYKRELRALIHRFLEQEPMSEFERRKLATVEWLWKQGCAFNNGTDKTQLVLLGIARKSPRLR